MGLGKLKPTLSWILQETWRTTRKAYTGTSAAKKRPEKMWTSCWMVQRTGWQRPKVLNVFFLSVLTVKTSHQKSQTPDTRGARGSWWLEKKKCHSCLQEGQVGSGIQPVSLISIAENVVEQLILKAISKHTENKKVMKGSQHGFRKEIIFLTNLINFQN